MNQHQTPAQLGFRWPAEWEPHAATWVAWPHNRNTWPGKFEPIPECFARLVEAIAVCEPVHILAGGDAVMSDAEKRVGHLPNVCLHDVCTNDAWARDHGPMFLVNEGLNPEPQAAIVDWGYNAWGNKYPPFDLDDRVPSRIARLLGRQHFQPGIVLEGGSVEGNGCGALLTTYGCLLNPNRNPGLSRTEIEWYLKAYCCAKKILFVDGALAGDDTDGHIDQIVRFVNSRTVVAAVSHDTRDENFAPLNKTYRQLLELTDQDDRPLDVVELPMPGAKYHHDVRLPASYANFYICNGAVIVPQFDDPADELAIRVLAKCFPDRRMVGLPALDIVWGLGAFHCLTQQEPCVGPSRSN